MKQTFTHDIEDFISARINCSQLRLEGNTDYQRNMCELDDISADAFNLANETINIAEKSAYMLGFHDGLTFMAGLSS